MFECLQLTNCKDPFMQVSEILNFKPFSIAFTQKCSTNSDCLISMVLVTNIIIIAYIVTSLDIILISVMGKLEFSIIGNTTLFLLFIILHNIL